jgi:diphthamide synthase subunit DPH2
MILRTVGKPKKVPIKLCKDAVKFYGKHLLGSRLYDKIEVQLEFDATDLGSTVYGFCDWNDDNHKARDFTIIVHPELGKRNMLIVLAHEMVHVKQYAKGEMKDYIRMNRVKFNGKIYNDDKIDYWDHPWEIEAHGRERGLYYRFLNGVR